MEKSELLLMLDEGLTVEEIPALENLDELEELVGNTNLKKESREKLLTGIRKMKKDTIRHSREFTEMIKYAALSK